MLLKTLVLSDQQVAAERICPAAYPGKDGEEAKKDGGSGGVGTFVERVVFRFRKLPLIGQKAETHKPDERPKHCGEKMHIIC